MSTPPPPPPLPLSDLPAGFEATDQASAQHQKVAARLLAAQLLALLVAAVGGSVNLKIDHHRVNLGGLLSLLGFATATVVVLIAQTRDAEGRWYRTRAAAESFKTLSWRYAVAGEPFGSCAQGTDEVLQGRFREILAGLDDNDLTPGSPGEQITGQMAALRAAPLTVRRASYVAGRIRDQEGWYSAKSIAAGRSARAWTVVAWAATALGTLLGLLRLVAVTDTDLLGLLAAGVAGAVAWTQFRQHRVLAASYAVAQQELAIVKITAGRIADENGWEAFVRDAEDAISREHTLWLARRGATPPRP